MMSKLNITIVAASLKSIIIRFPICSTEKMD